MADYKAMYYQLAGKISDAIEFLQVATQDTEEQYISYEETTVEISPKDENKT